MSRCHRRFRAFPAIEAAGERYSDRFGRCDFLCTNCLRSMIEVRPTTMPFLLTYLLLTLGPMMLSFRSRRASVMTHTHVENKGQRSAGLKARIKTNGRTEKTRPITVVNNVCCYQHRQDQGNGERRHSVPHTHSE